MGEIIKEALRIITGRFQNSRAFKAVLIVLAALVVLTGVFVAYPSFRAGVLAFSGDVFYKDRPELSDVAYDDVSRTVKGTVKGVKNPGDYRVILFILTDQWYVKPDFNAVTKNGMSELQSGGRFLINAFTGDQYDNDIKATQYAVFLVTSTYEGLKHMNDFDGAKAASVCSYIDTVP